MLDESAQEDLLHQPGTGLHPTGSTARTLSDDPVYLRLDSWLGAEWRIRRNERDIVILPYLRIINAIGERESLFYFQDSDDVTRAPRALARVPAIPVMGIRWHF